MPFHVFRNNLETSHFSVFLTERPVQGATFAKKSSKIQKIMHVHEFRESAAPDYPIILPKTSYTLKPDMTYNVDLFLTDGKKGFRFEDGFLVTETSVEELCSFTRDLIIA